MGQFRQWGVGVLLATAFSAAATLGCAQDFSGVNFPDPRLSRDNTYPENAASYYFADGPLIPQSNAPVDARLLLIFDASDSMKDDEYKVQILGAANALTSDTVLDAWFGPEERQSGPLKSVAIGVLVFDKNARMRVPWVDFRQDDPNLDERFEHFADYMRTLTETRDSSDNSATHIGAPLEYAVKMFENAPWSSLDRDVIDLSGDGKSNGGISYEKPKKTLADMAVTINALAMVNEEKDIVDWYEKNLITRLDENTEAVPGRVWVVARNMQDEGNSESTYLYFQRRFEEALKEKLVWEVAGLHPHSPPFCYKNTAPSRCDIIRLINRHG